MEICENGLNLEYVENFLDAKEADNLLKVLEQQITYMDPELTKVRVFGKWHHIPRQQVAFGDAGLSYKFSGTRIKACGWPDILEPLRDRLQHSTNQRYNFVLVNRYRDGQDHIGEHRDDEKELDGDAAIASISLGQPRRFVLRHVSTVRKLGGPPPIRFELGHGSLLLMKPPTNQYWYHSLPVSKTANGVRINLTFRKMNTP
ncbi:hypothetical protein AAG570_010019 [Ranatra chinensis]|uniref:DNA oxidative demethylase ALKBH2 n=1 Tax=Ranatra chinensis TaxID=642074 RepID=A0ABD0YLA8_9HEMI